MQDAELKAAAERARRFTHEIDGRRFELVTPTQFAVQRIIEDARTPGRTQRAIVLGALRGWSNLSTSDLRVAEINVEPLIYSADAAVLLLDERPDWEEALADVISGDVARRRKALEAAQGN